MKMNLNLLLSAFYFHILFHDFGGHEALWKVRWDLNSPTSSPKVRWHMFFRSFIACSYFDHNFCDKGWVTLICEISEKMEHCLFLEVGI